jgi:hypothetical protein
MTFDRRAALKRAMDHLQAYRYVERAMEGKYAGAFLQVGCTITYTMATIRCMYLKGQISKDQMRFALVRIQEGKPI